jgi:hypothetical protein
VLVIITTNHKVNGIYLPADDRRHLVAWSGLSKEDFTEEYWNQVWSWYENGGHEIVAHYLHNFDLTGFNPKAPPPKTRAFWEIVDASRAPEDSELADAIDALGRPDAATLTQIKTHVKTTEFVDWLNERKNARIIPHRMEDAGYEPVRNGDAEDGLWKINGRRQVIYAKQELSDRDKVIAARKIVSGGPQWKN